MLESGKLLTFIVKHTLKQHRRRKNQEGQFFAILILLGAISIYCFWQSLLFSSSLTAFHSKVTFAAPTSTGSRCLVIMDLDEQLALH